jgi:hypothetical protein
VRSNKWCNPHHYVAGEWDRRIEADAENGNLSGLVERALRDHNAGRSIKL